MVELVRVTVEEKVRPVRGRQRASTPSRAPPLSSLVPILPRISPAKKPRVTTGQVIPRGLTDPSFVAVPTSATSSSTPPYTALCTVRTRRRTTTRGRNRSTITSRSALHASIK